MATEAALQKLAETKLVIFFAGLDLLVTLREAVQCNGGGWGSAPSWLTAPWHHDSRHSIVSLAPQVDPDFGGSGMDATAAVIVHEELAAADSAFTLSYLAHSMLFANNVNQNGSEAQKAEFLPKACTGEAVCGMCVLPSACTLPPFSPPAGNW